MKQYCRVKNTPQRLILLITLSFVGHLSFGQNDGPKEITPQIVQNLKADIEKQIPTFKKLLSKKDFTAEQIEFSLDTFRIEKLVSKRMDIDYSTVGMNTTVEEKTTSYDKLMNKYYIKLLKILKPEDQKVIINAQRAWLIYRDAEAKLIETMTKNEYSGGGTIQSNIAVGSYAGLVVTRTIKIFNYYDDAVNNK
jgi:uncharacterized protein YecT (DUF1311 family)